MSLVGNVFFWIFAVLGVVAIIVYLGRLMDLRRAQIDYQDFLKGIFNILDAGSTDEALAICEDTYAPVASIVATAVRHAGGSARLLREAVDSQGRAEIRRLDRRLASLAIIAQIAPLVGLLGTVVGFIRTVLALNSAEIVTRPELMTGVMQALVSAAMGLIVAIPTMVMYGSLRVRLDRMVADLEAAASQIVGYISQHQGGERV